MNFVRVFGIETIDDKVGKEVVLEPMAKEIFDFQMEKARILIGNCKKGISSLNQP